QLLVQLDPSMTRVVQESAEAHLAKIVRNVCSMHSQIDVGKQKVSMFQSKRKKARNNYQHNTHIFKHGKIALKKNGKLNSANNVLVSAPQQLDRTILRSDNIIKIIKHPDVKNAAAYLRRAYLKNQSSTIVAPVSGYVAKRSVQIGSYVIPGTTLMVVVPLDHVWIEANLKETQLLSIRIGQPVEIRTDLYGKNIVFHGKVESLGIGTGSAFSLLPAQNASGNWIKIVQRLPVRISLDPDNLDCYPLRIGLSTQVKIDIHNTNGPVLMPHSVNKIYSATEIYNSKLYEADMLVTRIIHENCTHFWD
ncbi:MAG: efflux RND transporter periplasmic adaptor subunit, partial [Candidatus Baumannia cicadellinicola]|nr:efflux RND transporter periplasmic adaptor subunit [Candidatus Baumannia cicadellinicola]